MTQANILSFYNGITNAEDKSFIFIKNMIFSRNLGEFFEKIF